MAQASVNKITSVLPVERIEPVLPFWQALGFEIAVQVPQGESLGFVILSNGRTEVMYQSYASIEEDVAAVAALARGSRSFLFIEVEDVDAVIAALPGATPLFERRTTFYGADEIGFRDPAGHAISFAHFAEQPPEG